MDQATPYLWAYYRATVAGFSPQECADHGIPLLAADVDIWTQVSIVHPPSVAPGGGPLEPAAAYVSFEGEVTWEPEHGLQLVLKDSNAVCKVGPYDGHLTNGHAWGDPLLVDAIHRD